MRHQTNTSQTSQPVREEVVGTLYRAMRAIDPTAILDAAVLSLPGAIGATTAEVLLAAERFRQYNEGF